jgi:hypothetical protein
VVLTNDLDFPQILAHTRQAGPSVVLLRGEPLVPEARGAALLRALQDCEAELDRGAIVALDWSDKPRARVLPLRCRWVSMDRRRSQTAAWRRERCFRMIPAKARSASFASRALGNAAATSGSSTTTALPATYRDAYLLGRAWLKSYSGRISSAPTRSVDLRLLDDLFIVSSFLRSHRAAPGVAESRPLRLA